MKVLALDDKVLALAPRVLALALREKSSPCQGFPQDPGHVVAVHICSAHTHGVTGQFAISCLGLLSVKSMNCNKMEERSVQIFKPYERSFSLVF